MAHQVTLTIPNNIFQQAQNLARKQARPVEDILSESIVLQKSVNFTDLSEVNPELDQEMEAYIAMHPQLRQTMLGKHVAVYQSELIDSDDNLDKLTERIHAKYPSETVWVSKIKDKPIDTSYMHSLYS